MSACLGAAVDAQGLRIAVGWGRGFSGPRLLVRTSPAHGQDEPPAPLPALPAAAAKDRGPQSWDHRASCPGDQGVPSAPPAPPATSPKHRATSWTGRCPSGPPGASGLAPALSARGMSSWAPGHLQCGPPRAELGTDFCVRDSPSFFRPTCLYSDRQLCSAVGCRDGSGCSAGLGLLGVSSVPGAQP